MKCKVCKFESNCSLREIAKDIIGCEGHSKSKYENDELVQCATCGCWSYEDDTFKLEDGVYTCYECY